MIGGNGDDGSRLSNIVDRVAGTAKIAGKSMAVPAVKQYVREKAVEALRDNDPEDLERYITVNYPLIRNSLSDEVKQALGNACPQFEGVIKSTVTPDKVMYWLENPEEWMDEDADEETLEEIRQAAQIIHETPGGERWLQNQVIDLWDIGNIL